MSGLVIHQFPCLADNYGFLVHDTATGATATIDTPDAVEINRQLNAKNWRLSDIFNTHWHSDHTGGNVALKRQWGCKISGPAGEAARIPGLDVALTEGDQVTLGDQAAAVWQTPGHTAGHIIFHFAKAKAAFVGDTLFALGCGRLFEGTPEQMWASLLALRALPDDTRIYCAHEYTEANAAFAITAEPGNPALKARYEQIKTLRRAGQPTVPTTIGVEKATNPFLRADIPAVQAAMNLEKAEASDVFAEIRRRKDAF